MTIIGNFYVDPIYARFNFIGYVPTNNAEALAISLESWKLRLQHILNMNEEITPDSADSSVCGFCMLHIDSNCKDCPVARYTGSPMCHNTPYTQLYKSDSKAETLSIIIAEIDLLEKIGNNAEVMKD